MVPPVDARSAVARELERGGGEAELCAALSRLLQQLMEGEPGWDARYDWLDGVAATSIEKSAGVLRLSGEAFHVNGRTTTRVPVEAELALAPARSRLRLAAHAFEVVLYRPHMSEEYAEQIRRWHEHAYDAAVAEAGYAGQEFDYLGRTIRVPPDVQPITGMAHLLGEAVLEETRAGDRVLDMGTGSGVNAILAAADAASVVAVDISPAAVDAARANAVLNGVDVDVRQGDVFDAVGGEFDLIVFDPPFRWFAPRSVLEAATTDEDYGALTRFFAEVGDHLAPGGRILLFFGTSGDIAYVRELIAEAGLEATVVAQESLERDGWTVDYFTFRLTRV
jgi:release factor glutamine methyltransferase